MDLDNDTTDPAELIDIQIDQIDRSAPPAGVRANGKPFWTTRCRVPFRYNVDSLKLVQIHRAEPKPDDAPDGTRAKDGEDEEFDEGDTVLIKGIASSTGVDWYGTRMAYSALENMREQFAGKRVAYLPRHDTWFKPVEWDEQYGVCVDGEIVKGEVQESATDGDDYLLWCTAELWMDDERARKLVRRIKKGLSPGQSIGGWFTKIAVSYDDDGYVDDIEILEVELDHLATVRNNANFESDKIVLAGKAAIDSAFARRVAPSSEPRGLAPADPAARSTSSVPTPVPAEDPPAPETVSSQRGQQDIDMTPEELRAILGESLAPINDRLAKLEGERSAPAPASAPTPAPADPVAEARAIAEQARAAAAAAEQRAAQALAEAEAAKAQLAAKDSDAGNRSARTPQPGARNAGDDPGFDPNQEYTTRSGLDLRTVCPKAIRTVRRSAGEIPFTPYLVAEHDGIVALGKIVKDERGGDSALVDLLERHKEFAIPGMRGARALARSFSGVAIARSDDSGVDSFIPEDGADLLREVIHAAVDDGFITPKTRHATWS